MCLRLHLSDIRDIAGWQMIDVVFFETVNGSDFGRRRAVILLEAVNLGIPPGIVIWLVIVYIKPTWFFRPGQAKRFCLSDTPQRAGRTENLL
jgi:hypothetical protein